MSSSQLEHLQWLYTMHNIGISLHNKSFATYVLLNFLYTVPLASYCILSDPDAGSTQPLLDLSPEPPLVLEEVEFFLFFANKGGNKNVIRPSIH